MTAKIRGIVVEAGHMECGDRKRGDAGYGPIRESHLFLLLIVAIYDISSK